MPARWTIETEPAKGLLRMVLAGTYSVADVERLDLERKSAIGALKIAFNHYVVLIDVRGCDISSQDVAAALNTAIGNPVFRARRCAMVVASTLVRMQARRVVDRPDLQFFEDPAEAEAWLLADAAAAA